MWTLALETNLDRVQRKCRTMRSHRSLWTGRMISQPSPWFRVLRNTIRWKRYQMTNQLTIWTMTEAINSTMRSNEATQATLGTIKSLQTPLTCQGLWCTTKTIGSVFCHRRFQSSWRTIQICHQNWFLKISLMMKTARSTIITITVTIWSIKPMWISILDSPNWRQRTFRTKWETIRISSEDNLTWTWDSLVLSSCWTCSKRMASLDYNKAWTPTLQDYSLTSQYRTNWGCSSCRICLILQVLYPCNRILQPMDSMTIR